MSIRLQKEITFFSTLFFGISLFVFWLFTGGAYAKNIRYELFLLSPFTNADLKTGKLLNFNTKPQNDNSLAPAETLSTPDATKKENHEDYQIIIPKIFVSSPIVFPKSDSTKDILTSLEDGVGLYPGSSLPGYPGRTIILGHSSRPYIYRGNYATVFTLLEKLRIGDQFYITNGNKKFIYEVFDANTLTPEETDTVLAQNPIVNTELDLITCWPIGASSKRTLVQAKLIATELQ